MSRYFKLEELLYSKTALDGKILNLPSWEVVENLKRLSEDILDPVREEMGEAVNVSSGFRSNKLNQKLKGADNSQHKYGEAADIYSRDNKKLFNTCKKLIVEGKITVGQLIWEKGTAVAPDWVHISLPTEEHHNEILFIGVKK